jgi:hypothetical protein
MKNCKLPPANQTKLGQIVVKQPAEIMKSSLRQLVASTLIFCAILGSAIPGYSQTTVLVDSTAPWGGYMNVYNNVGGSQGGYLWGSGWGIAALTAYFNGTNNVTIIPNTNCWNVLDPYWVNTNTVPYSGAKWMEANFYVDVPTALAGQAVTFTGTCLSNTLVSPYTAMAVIKEFAPGYTLAGMTTVGLVDGSEFTVTRNIAAGHITQYGFIVTGPDANPATVSSLGRVVIAVTNADPSLSAVASQALIEGQTASFAVTAQGTAPLRYQWVQVTATATNILSNTGRISGAKTNSLNIASLVASDAGTYRVFVTNGLGSSASQSANLMLIPLSQAQTNLLIDPGFEQGYFSYDAAAGWYPYNGTAEASTNDYYYLSATPVSVVDGAYCTQTYSTGSGSYNGVYQDRPALPGQVYTANCWFLTPIEDAITGSNVCYLEVQFRDASDVPLVQYASTLIDASFPTSTWFNLVPTNIHNGNNFTNYVGTSPYMVAPPGTAKVRYQVTYHGQDGFGSVYVDAAALMLEEPVVTAAISGGQVQLSFPTLYGPKYQVYYKTNVTDPTWHALGSPVTGDGSVKTVSDGSGSTPRFYTVNTL